MTVIAIGLDSAEPSVLEQWMAAGELPNLAKLRAEGAYGRLENFSMFTAELPWTTFATGVMPDQTGYWTPLKYSPDYRVDTRAAYEYDAYPAFFALGEQYRVCSFDVPQVRLQNNLHGWQFNAWGAHSPQVEQDSNVPQVYEQLLAKHGAHPGLHRDYAHALNMQAVARVYDMLIEGIDRRASICVDLLQQQRWDLFLTVFGETHGGGHNFWQFQPEHPLFDAKIPGREQLPENPLRETYKAIDRALGRIVEAAPPASQVLIFSAHGMGPNTMDLPSTMFLPELMYRINFDRPALGDVPSVELPLTEQITSMAWHTWERHVWNTISKGNPLIKWARKACPTRVYNRLAPLLEFKSDAYPMGPVEARRVCDGLPWYQPTLWYKKLWPNMQAFALPSFSEGYVRINLKGREANGVVEPADYHRVVEDICQQLRQLRCARTGTPMVAQIEKTRDDPLDADPRLADADIVIGWQEAYATDAVTHPRYGRIGPIPHFRAGSHRHSGFMLARGSKIEPGSQVHSAHALDIAPTVMAMLGAEIPAYMNGKNCLGTMDGKPSEKPEAAKPESNPRRRAEVTG